MLEILNIGYDLMLFWKIEFKISKQTENLNFQDNSEKTTSKMTDFCNQFSNMGFSSTSDNKESASNEAVVGSIPGLVRSPGEENGNLLQYSCLGNPMDRGSWNATVHGIAELGTMKQLTLAYVCFTYLFSGCII